MAEIAFKTKIRDGIITVPTFKRVHCDMAAFRTHPKYGGLANSDLFPSVLAGIRRDLVCRDPRGHLKMDSLPSNVQVDSSGFLASVIVSV